MKNKDRVDAESVGWPIFGLGVFVGLILSWIKVLRGGRKN